MNSASNYTTGPRSVGWVSGTALLVTLLIVNIAAMWGQGGWALTEIAPAIIPAGWEYAAIGTLIVAAGFAAAVEGIGVFLAMSADESDEAGLPAGGLRLASYAYGVIVSGGLNLSHWGASAAGFAFFALSAISPFLWGIRARIRRARKVAPSRRLWHPVKSIKLIRLMAWEGITTEEDGMARMLTAPTVEVPAPEVPADEVPADEPVEPVQQIEQAAKPRRQRALPGGSSAALDTVRALMADIAVSPADVAAQTGLSVQAVRKYRQVVARLHADPTADVSSMKLSGDAVGVVRQWAAGAL